MGKTFCAHCRLPSGLAASILATILLTLSFPVLAVTPANVSEQGAVALDIHEQLRQQERERALREQNAPEADTRLARPSRCLTIPLMKPPVLPLTRYPLSANLQIVFSGHSARPLTLKGAAWVARALSLSSIKCKTPYWREATSPPALWHRSRT